ncbi:hypothetical protein Cabys_3075 [Caldithrix abyssi DSM 13497]|uniref:Uncharacterized protein n=1 Tax=Caldithrix abyssi DSM 13497 TaxID=880073 RepID=A0A1J1CAW5_CALAY|nr:hypothetical protein Cabys_3075 [Caldithrix abyssi DSM 13497]
MPKNWTIQPINHPLNRLIMAFFDEAAFRLIFFFHQYSLI